ncbi:MAG TPA: hypothetical protein EYG73_13915 [Arcobacter sp.]|nr:hypothetical protein [Arcobacter sp.]
MENNLKDYLVDISSKLKMNLLIAFLAFLIYVVWYTCEINKYFSFSHLHISLGHIGYTGLLIIPAFLVIDKVFLQKLWIFFSTLALLDLPNLLYITNNQPINNSLFFSSLTITILIILFFLATLLGTSKSVSSNPITTSWKDLRLVVLSSLVFIIIYHSINSINSILRATPNDERSIYIANLEFHHINIGIILLLWIPFLFKYIPRLSKKIYKILGYIFVGFIYGTIFDESFYYMLNNVSDDNYFDILITLTSLIITIISFYIWFYYLKKEHKHDS